MTIRDILPMVPKQVYKSILQGYLNIEDNKTEMLDRDYLETPGDLNELKQILVNDLEGYNDFKDQYGYNNQQMLIRLKDLALTSWGLMGYKDFENLQCYKHFKELYPKMAETIIIWGWS